MLWEIKNFVNLNTMKENTNWKFLSLRIGLIIGLLCNSIFLFKALPYLFLPIGSVVSPDIIYNQMFPYVVLFSVGAGIPFTIWDAVRMRGLRFNAIITIISVALCLVTPCTPLKLQKLIGDARQLKTPCVICDGPNPMKGLYLVY